MMLVLMRKRKQSISIGDNIKVTVLSTSRGRVRLGIDAPEGIKISRDEPQDEINKTENVTPSAVVAGGN